MLWLKYEAWEKGISPKEFRECLMHDIEDIVDIKTAISEKKMLNSEIKKLINSTSMMI